MSLVKSLADETRAKIERAETEAAEAHRIAVAWDAAGYTERAPWIIHPRGPQSYDGSVGMLSFKEMRPDEVLRLLDKFPAVPQRFARTPGQNDRTVRPVGSDFGSRTEQREVEGIKLSIDGGIGYGQKVIVSWYANIGGLRIELSCEMWPTLQIMPRASRRVIQHGNAPAYYVGPTSFHWPDGFEGPGCADWLISYAPGSHTALGHQVVYAGVRRWLEWAAALLAAEKADCRAAYDALTGGLQAPRVATDDEVAEARALYTRTKLRAGTLLQMATLQTDTAKAWEQAARRAWTAFCDAQGVQTGRYGFDGYAFAVWYLERAGILSDEGNKYGAAWH